MKIAVNTRFLIKDKMEGIGVFTAEILKKIIKDHPEHEFIFIFDRKADPEFILSGNIKPLVLFPPARHPFLWLIWYEWSLHRALKRIKPDIFISMDGMLPLRTTTKSIAVIHDIAFESYPEAVPFLVRKFYKFFFPRYAHKADKIITVSEFSKQDIAEKYHIPKDKIEVVYNGSKDIFKTVSEDEKQQSRVTYCDGKAYFLYVGSLHPRKNIANLLKAFDLYKSKSPNEMKLLLAGRKAWQTKEMEQAYNDMQHKADVVFTGWLPDEQLAKVMASADAFVYISLFEGFGIPVLNALNCDVPGIVSNTSSLPEVVGGAGLLVNPNDIGEIADAMQKIVTDAELRKELIEKGRLQRAKFGWGKSADKFGRILINYFLL